MQHRFLATTLLTLNLFGTVAPAQSEANAIKAFKHAFKPKAKALAIKKALLSYRTNSPEYLSAIARRDQTSDRWKGAVRGLQGYGSVAIAKLVAEGWIKVDKEVRSTSKLHRQLEKGVAKDYAKFIKANDGKSALPGQRLTSKAISAYRQWLTGNRQSSELQRDITDLAALYDELRQVVTAMQRTDGLRWMLDAVIGNKKYALSLKVAAIRQASSLGKSMLPDLTKALDKAKTPDVLAAILFGIAVYGEAAKASAPTILPLLQHADAGVREQAALALQHMLVAAAIEPMIRLLASEIGQARLRIAAALEILTSQQFGTNISAWQGWFAKEGAAYVAGEKPLGRGRPSQHRKFDEKNYYYGIPQIGKGIVYVIDCSGSMIVDKDDPQWDDPQQNRIPRPADDPSNSRSEASKRELVRALGTLSSNQKFNIVWYNHSATLFKKSMVAATPKNLTAATEFVRDLPADSSTNIYDAMKLAFTLTGRGSYDKYYGVEFDTVFLLTDGKPTLQGIGDDDPNKIIEGVRQWNPLQRVVIHTIAMGTSGIDHDFMRTLAKENRGEYRKILKGGKVVKDGEEKADGKKGPAKKAGK